MWQTERDRWGDISDRQLLVKTPTLTCEHLYPMERRLIALVDKELRERRRIMVFYEQNDLRSMARRLEWVLRDVHPWTLPNSVAAEDRQQAIIEAVRLGHTVVLVPYRRVNEGLNLQSAVDTILWYEMALNLFMLDQASRRAWRLGKREEVRIYYMAYANTAGHHKLRKLGQQSGAAAAFAGEPARGALIEHAGADKTTLARLSSLLDMGEGASEEQVIALPASLSEAEVNQEEAQLKAVFARRADELRQALLRGRQWFGGLADDLEERLARLASCPTFRTPVWAEHPLPALARFTPPRSAIAGTERATEEWAQAAVTARDNQQPGTANDLSTNERTVLPQVISPALPPQDMSPVGDAAFVPLPLLASETHPARSAALPVAPAATIGSRAAVVFGQAEHIALSRVRSRSRRHPAFTGEVKRRTPVAVRDIPSLVDGETAGRANGLTQAEETQITIAFPSLWDLLNPAAHCDHNETGMKESIPSAIPTHGPSQQGLWG